MVVLTDKNIKCTAIDNDLIYVFENKKSFAKRLARYENSNEECLRVTHPDIDKLFESVKTCFTFIEAAGGLVILPDNRVLAIKRRGKWDLPKGKAEKGESLRETAVREVIEECGLSATPKIIRKITDTYHTYHQSGDHILKHIAWYAMSYDGDNALTPQTEEDIVNAVWLPENQLDIILQDTYQSVKEVLKAWK